MSRLVKATLACLLAAHAAAAFAVTGMKYISTPGDYIGGGQTQVFEPPEATITANGDARVVHIGVTDPGNWWYLDFAAPVGSDLSRGSYPAAARYPFQSPLGAGLSMYGNGRGCNTLKGWFRVREYELDGNGNVARLAIDFLQNCEVTNPPLYGTVRINSSYPLSVPNTVAIAGADFDTVAGELTTLDGAQSFSRRHAPLAYKWTQVDGPAVDLKGAKTATPSFTAPEVGLKGDTLRFRLEVTDAAGKSYDDHVLVLVENPAARQTRISFHGDAGDWVTGGRSYRYTTRNATIDFSRNFDDGVSAAISGDTWWSFDSATPAGTPFRPGTYLNATRYPFQDDAAPGLSLSGDGRGCNTLTGQFTVHQAKFDDAGNPAKLSMSFEQHCEGGAPAAYGEVLLNAVPAQVLATKLRAARQRFGTE